MSPFAAAEAGSPLAAPSPRPVRVALVRPPIFQILTSLSYFGAVPPIGLAYIAAVLREAGHALTVVDAAGEALDRVVRVGGAVSSLYRSGLTPEEVVARLPVDTELVGITHMFHHEWPTIRAIAEGARARCPRAFIVVGGENATAAWEQILAECPAVDACVLGEGEATALELAARLAAGAPLDDLAGLALRAPPDGRRTEAPRLPRRLTRLDAIPLPAWELFPMAAYFRGADTFGVHRGRSIPLLATRGCPFQCTFCSSPKMWTTRYVTRPPQDVVDEIRTWIERYGVDNVDFCDLTAIIKRDWILEFCQRLDDSGVRVTWQLPVGTRSEALDGEVLRALYRTGCRNLTYAPESGSPRLLKLIKKRVQLPRLTASLREAVGAGLVARMSIILGHPKETRADVLQTVRLLWTAARMGCHDVSVMIFAPYPGSEDYAELEAAGLVGGDVADAYVGLARSGGSARTFNPTMGRNELLAWQWSMLLFFYGVAYVRRPARILDMLRMFATGSEQSQVEQLVRTKLGQVREATARALRRAPSAETPPDRTSA